VERAKNRPFHCNICGKGFATESSLRTHTSKVSHVCTKSDVQPARFAVTRCRYKRNIMGGNCHDTVKRDRQERSRQSCCISPLIGKTSNGNRDHVLTLSRATRSVYARTWWWWVHACLDTRVHLYSRFPCLSALCPPFPLFRLEGSLHIYIYIYTRARARARNTHLCVYAYIHILYIYIYNNRCISSVLKQSPPQETARSSALKLARVDYSDPARCRLNDRATSRS